MTAFNKMAWLEMVTEADVSHAAARIGSILAVRYHSESRDPFPSLATLAEKAKASISTVKRAILELDRAGFLDRTDGRGSRRRTVYTLRFPGNVVPISVARKRQDRVHESPANRPAKANGRAAKGSQVSFRKSTRELSYNKDDPNHRTQARAPARAAPPEVAQLYRAHRFEGNATDGPRVVPKSEFGPLNDWAAWLEAERMPQLCDLPVGPNGARGGAFFCLPSLRPPSTERGRSEARSYFVAALDADAARRAAQ